MKKAGKATGWVLIIIIAAAVIYIAITPRRALKNEEPKLESQSSGAATDKVTIDDNLQVESNLSIGSEEAVISIK